ncbi:MAG: hypothetical protein GXP54_00965, partial [Deltaproteobacteria bacterium]|nr:hypothetical protein [Deltaproteobacteria bacterium]
MSVPFFDMHRHITPVREELDRAIEGVLDECAFIQGPDVARLESEIAAYVNV